MDAFDPTLRPLLVELVMKGNQLSTKENKDEHQPTTTCSQR